MTRIYLIGDVWNTGVNDYLELSQEVDVPLNFAISDVRDLSKRTGTFSKSIKVAGTKHNSQVLNHLFDVNMVSGVATFDINKRQSCLIEQDGVVVLDNALIQLTQVEITSQGGNDYEKVDYIVTVKDTMADFFTTLGNDRIQDLDFSDLNHTYNTTNVVASFDHDFTDGYKYLLPMATDTTYELIEMKPAVYARTYWDRLWDRAGFRYVWDSKDDVLFNQWLHPYSGSKSELADETIEEARVEAENTTSEDYEAEVLIIPTGGTLDEFDVYETPIEIYDDNNYFNDATSEYTNPFSLPTPNSLTYEITLDLTLVLDNYSGVDIRVDRAFLVRQMLQIRRSGISIQNQPVFPTSSTGGTISYVTTSDAHGIGRPVGSVLPNGETALYSFQGVVEMSVSDLAINDVLTLGGRLERLSVGGFYGRMVIDSSGVFTDDWDFITRIDDIKIKIKPSTDAFGFNFPVVMNLYSIRNMKQSEYVKSIMTMLNLYALINPNDPKELILKHRDEYYDEGTVKNWDSKLAKEKQHKITFLPELTAKRLKLTYKVDKDPVNVGYVQNVGEVYGEVEYEFDNEYIKNDEKKEVSFGASPFLKSPFGAITMAVNGVEPNTLPRVVIDGGKLSCGFYEILDYGTTGASLNEYPYAGHFDKPVNPTFDLNFGKCAYYFDDSYGVATSNNLANLFWRRTMAQINSGKMFTGYFNLTVQDIADLSLNDKIYLLGKYWNINKVIDYNANKRGLTKVELLSADDELALPKFPIRRPVGKPWGGGYDSDSVSSLAMSINDSLNLKPATVAVYGKKNFVTQNVKNAVVVGNNNFVTQDGIYTPYLNVGGATIATPVKSYRANISQTSTNAPVVNWENNNLGGTPVWSRNSAGIYYLTLVDAFEGNVYVSVTNAESSSRNWQVGGKKLDDDTVVIASSNITSKALEDDFLEDTTVIIEVY
jgi:hypothetical protein